MEPKWSQLEVKRKWNGFGIHSESVGNQLAAPMEVVWNWSPNSMNYLGICLEFIGNCWAMSEEFLGNSYELFGKPSGIHGEFLGN